MYDAGMKVPSIVNLQYVVPATIIVYIGNMKKTNKKYIIQFNIFANNCNHEIRKSKKK